MLPGVMEARGNREGTEFPTMLLADRFGPHQLMLAPRRVVLLYSLVLPTTHLLTSPTTPVDVVARSVMAQAVSLLQTSEAPAGTAAVVVMLPRLDLLHLCHDMLHEDVPQELVSYVVLNFVTLDHASATAAAEAGIVATESTEAFMRRFRQEWLELHCHMGNVDL